MAGEGGSEDAASAAGGDAVANHGAAGGPWPGATFFVLTLVTIVALGALVLHRGTQSGGAPNTGALPSGISPWAGDC